MNTTNKCLYSKDINNFKPISKKNLNYRVFFVSLSSTNKYTNFLHFQSFNTNYLRNIYDINLKEKNINAVYSLPKKISKLLMFKVRNLHYKQFGIKYFNEIAQLFVTNIWLKNSKNICKYIKKKLDSVHFKKHRAYFLFYFRILNKYIVPNFKVLQVKGVTLVFKGKLAKGGNARKRTMFFKKGYYSLSNKLLSLNLNKWDVWTRTGTFGCTMQIFYKNYDNLFKFLYNNLCYYTNTITVFTI